MITCSIPAARETALPRRARRSDLLYGLLVGVFVCSNVCQGQKQSTIVDPRGPVANAGMTVAVGADGVQAAGYSYDPARGRRTAPWKAVWVRTPGACRKEVVLAAAPRQVKAWVGSSDQYQLFLNDRLVLRGPINAGADGEWGGKIRNRPAAPNRAFNLASGLWFYDYRDLTPYFHEGTNELSFHGGSALIFEAEVTDTHGHVTIIASDGTWPECQPMEANHPQFWLSEIPPRMEAVYPVQQIVRASPGVMVPDKPFQDGHAIVLTNNGSFAVKYDRDLSAYTGLKVKGGAGAKVRIQGNEVDAPNGTRPWEFVLQDGVQYRESGHYDSYTVINIEVSNVTTPVEIQDVRAVFTSYPVTYRGAFACNDERLNRIWKASRWGAQLCMQDYHLDSPNHQEPLADPGDYMIIAKINYYAFGSPWLARQDVRKFAHILDNVNYQNFHTSYALMWLQMLMDNYLYTGDKALIEEMAPYVHRLLAQFASYRGKNGLISEASDYMFLDWVDIAGFPGHHPPAVIGQGYMTALYYRALQDAQQIAALTGDQAKAAGYAQLAADVKAAFNRELWSEEKGRYRDGRPFQTSVEPNAWLPADKNIETFTAQVNTFAVLYDLAPQERQAAIMEKVMADQPLNCQVYFMYFVLEALAHAGILDKYGTGQMRRWQVIEPTGTFNEMWNGGDLSHGWQGAPLIQLSSHVLGVVPTSAGYKTMAIRPTLCDLRLAKGVVPTMHGDISVAWRLANQGWECAVTVPAGMAGEFTFPSGKFQNPTLTMDGRTIWQDGVPRGKAGAKATEAGVSVKINAGQHKFAVL